VLDHTLRLIDVLEMLLSRPAGIESQAWSVPTSATAPEHVWEDIDRSIGPLRAALREHLDKILSDERPAWSMLKWAAMFHDISKPATRSVDLDGRIRFFEHEDAGATVAAERMQRLRFSTVEINRVMAIIQHHMRPHHLLDSGMSRRAAYRFFRDTGEAGVDVLLLSLADHLATYGLDLDPDRWARRLDLARAMLDEYFHRHAETISPPPLITGHDVMAVLKLKPGREVGEILETVREAQAAGEVRTREEALDMARTLSDERRTTKVE
jgi:putative nucleotidyltransferase with HDIG domain